MVYDKSLQCLKLTQMSRIRNLDVSEGGGRKTPGITRNFNIFSKKLHFISSDIFILRIKQERAESEMVTQKMPRIAHPYYIQFLPINLDWAAINSTGDMARTKKRGTDGRTDGQTDRRTDGQGVILQTPSGFPGWGLKIGRILYKMMRHFKKSAQRDYRRYRIFRCITRGLYTDFTYKTPGCGLYTGAGNASISFTTRLSKDSDHSLETIRYWTNQSQFEII